MNTKGLVATLVLGLGLLLGLMWMVSDRLPVAHALSIDVSIETDENDGCFVGKCSLREAIIFANGHPAVDTINLQNVTYTLSIGGTGEDAGATGDLDISSPLTITGKGPSLTWIDADEIDRVFDISGTITVVISGVTIMNGNIYGYGGGIDVGDANLVLYNTNVVSNTAHATIAYGGGLYVNGGSATMHGGKLHDNLVDGTHGKGGGLYAESGQTTIDGAYITSNTLDASVEHGAGVYVGSGSATISETQISDNTGKHGAGVYVATGQATISGTQISGNTGMYGVGVYVGTGQATISGGQISGNTGQQGVGVYVGAGQATINGVPISGNTSHATSSFGGGVYVGTGQATINGAQVSGNTVEGTSAYGAGVYVDQGSATISQTHLFNNSCLQSTSFYGGGLYVASGSATLFGGRVYSNTAENGGGVYVSAGTAVLSGTAVYSNTAEEGGGVFVYLGGAVLSGTAVYSNTAEEGGGIHNNGGITLTNVTLSHNEATEDEGGGIYNTDEGTGLLTFVTVAFNESAAGGTGIHGEPGGIVRAKNTIVTANGPQNCNAGIFSDGWNLEGGNTCGLTKPSDQPNAKLILGPLQDNGGGTLTHALQPGSRAIDAGVCLPSIPQDQRGRARPNPGSSFCDIGAYEASDVGVTNLVLVKHVTPGSAIRGAAVTYTLEFSNTGPSGALRVMITDSVPVSVTGATFANTGATITALPGTPYVWQVQDLLPGAGGIITIRGVLSEPLATGVFTNEAVIASSVNEPTGADNWGRAALTVFNMAPAAQDDSYSTAHDQQLSVAAPGVLDNDSDAEGDSMQAVLEGDVTSGTLSLDADGSFVYTPDTGFAGTDSFTYRASDGALASDVATVSIVVGGADQEEGKVFLPLVLKDR